MPIDDLGFRDFGTKVMDYTNLIICMFPEVGFFAGSC